MERTYEQAHQDERLMVHILNMLAAEGYDAERASALLHRAADWPVAGMDRLRRYDGHMFPLRATHPLKRFLMNAEGT